MHRHRIHRAAIHYFRQMAYLLEGWWRIRLRAETPPRRFRRELASGREPDLAEDVG